jgi:ketosteroid isomerase-like protein
MSPQAKLDLALRSYAAFSAGPDVEALLPLYDPACEWRFGDMGLDTPTVFIGHDGLREMARWINEWIRAFKVTIEEVRIAADGRMPYRGDHLDRPRTSSTNDVGDGRSSALTHRNAQSASANLGARVSGTDGGCRLLRKGVVDHLHPALRETLGARPTQQSRRSSPTRSYP